MDTINLSFVHFRLSLQVGIIPYSIETLQRVAQVWVYKIVVGRQAIGLYSRLLAHNEFIRPSGFVRSPMACRAQYHKMPRSIAIE